MARDIEGQNSANPVSMLLSAVLMLRHIGLVSEAEQIHSAVMTTLSSGKVNVAGSLSR